MACYGICSSESELLEEGSLWDLIKCKDLCTRERNTYNVKLNGKTLDELSDLCSSFCEYLSNYEKSKFLPELSCSNYNIYDLEDARKLFREIDGVFKDSEVNVSMTSHILMMTGDYFKGYGLRIVHSGDDGTLIPKQWVEEAQCRDFTNSFYNKLFSETGLHTLLTPLVMNLQKEPVKGEMISVVYATPLENLCAKFFKKNEFRLNFSVLDIKATNYQRRGMWEENTGGIELFLKEFNLWEISQSLLNNETFVGKVLEAQF